MPWVKTDDKHREHPKTAAAGPLAAHLDQIAWEYCSSNLTDGFVPKAVVRMLVDWSGVKWQGRVVDPLALAEHLCSEQVARWEHAPGGYQVHDYLAYNPTKAQVEAGREHINEARAEAGRRGGLKSGEVRRSKYEARREATPEANTKQNESPVPVPRPVPHEALTQEEHLHKQQTARAGERPRGRPAGRGVHEYPDDFLSWWAVYPRHDAKLPASESYEKRRNDGRPADVLLAAAQHLAAYVDDRGIENEKIPHATTFLNQHRDEDWQNGPPDAARSVVANGRPKREDEGVQGERIARSRLADLAIGGST